jgi:hypothetical protein
MDDGQNPKHTIIPSVIYQCPMPSESPSREEFFMHFPQGMPKITTFHKSLLAC